jgi:PEP-CTERM motif
MKMVQGSNSSLMRRLAWVAAFVVTVLVFASPSFADTSMVLTGVGDGATVGDVYVDPYTATVGGVAGVSVICDDWSNNTYLNESWMANPLSATAASTSGAPMFGNNQTLYNEVTYLASQLMLNPTNTTDQAEYSFAIWALTYGANGTTEESPAPLTYLAENVSGSEYQATLVLICEAEGGYCAANGQTYAGEANFNAAGWEILTPEAGTSMPSTDGTPQEFLTYVGTPEPSTMLMLGLGIAGLFLLKRRQRNAGSAPVLAA